MSPATARVGNDRGARISEGMRLAAAAKLVQDRPQEFAELNSSDFEDGHPRHDPISTVWMGKHRAAIRFHAARGMSRTSLSAIYGRDTVLAVLGAA